MDGVRVVRGLAPIFGLIVDCVNVWCVCMCACMLAIVGECHYFSLGPNISISAKNTHTERETTKKHSVLYICRCVVSIYILLCLFNCKNCSFQFIEAHARCLFDWSNVNRAFRWTKTKKSRKARTWNVRQLDTRLQIVDIRYVYIDFYVICLEQKETNHTQTHTQNCITARITVKSKS